MARLLKTKCFQKQLPRRNQSIIRSHHMKTQKNDSELVVGRGGKLTGAGSLLVLSCLSAHANLNIIPTFAANILSDPNSALIQAAINADVSQMNSYIANNTTVNITFQETTTGLGSSSTLHYSPTYSTYYNQLLNVQTRSSFDNTAVASLPNQANNPVNGSGNVTEQTSLARALGYANYTGGPDGTISLNMSLMNLSRTGPQNPSLYDLQAVAMHEIDEVLGIGGPGSSLPTLTGAVGPLDLFRYSAAGVRSFSLSTTVTPYFSINGGLNNLAFFNQAGNGSDYADWGNGVSPAQQQGNTPGMVQDAFGGPGAQPNLGSAELIALDVIGWNLTPLGASLESVPEPTTFSLLLTGLLGTGYLFRRQR